jgi:surfactin synthase thioesterase subunit
LTFERRQLDDRYQDELAEDVFEKNEYLKHHPFLFLGPSVGGIFEVFGSFDLVFNH